MPTIDRTRARGVTLRLLNLEPVIAEATLKIRAAKAALGAEDADQLTIKIGGNAPYAYGVTSDGKAYVVCHEGVGFRVDQDGLPLSVYISSPGHMAIIPEMQLHLTPDEVAGCITEERIDLAELVRTHGARLEDNFWIMRDALMGGH